MTNAYTITADDWLKYIRAQGRMTLEYVGDAIAGKMTDDVPDDQADGFCDAIDSVRELITEAPLEDPHHYGDGRRVWTQLDDPAFAFRYIWHPDPAHEHNRPRQLGSSPLWDEDGVARTVIITAPGILDLLTVRDGRPPTLNLIQGGK